MLPLRLLQEDWRPEFSEAGRYQVGRALAQSSDFETALAEGPLSPAYVCLYAGAFEAGGASHAEFRRAFLEMVRGLDRAQ